MGWIASLRSERRARLIDATKLGEHKLRRLHMSNNAYIKINLTLITFCLLVIALRDIPFIAVAKADRLAHCTGTIIVNRYGDVEPNIGGYDVDLKCG